MDTAEWNSNMLRILSCLSSLSPGCQEELRKKCTTPAKHGALYPRAVDLPHQVDVTDFSYIHFFICLFFEPDVCYALFTPS